MSTLTGSHMASLALISSVQATLLHKCPTLGDWPFWATAANSLGAEVIRSQAGIVNLQEDIGIVHGGREDLQGKGHRSLVKWTSLARLHCSQHLALAFMLLPESPPPPTSLRHSSLKGNLWESSFDPGLC